METPKFFCENCGGEVNRNAHFCPHCGRIFASVRCPSCNYFGSSSQFAKGCPKCGYAFHPKKEKQKNITNKKKTYKAYDDTLPKWVYALVFGILIVVIIAILFH